MSKARGLADLGNAYDDGALSNRNLIINGAMQVAQRGVSFSHTGAHSTYTVDRWLHVTNGTSSTTAQTWTTINSEKVIALTSTSTSSTYNVLLQRLEGLRSLQGKEVTLSAYVKGAAGTFAQYMEFRDSGGNVVSFVNTNLNITTAWQKFTWTVTVPTDASFDNDSSWFNVSFYGGASLDIAQVQLEVGDTATPFEHRSYGDELARCQRYFQRFSLGQYNPVGIGTKATGNTSSVIFQLRNLHGPMRVAPTGSISSTTGTAIVLTNIGSGVYSATSVGLNTYSDGSWWLYGISSLPVRESDFYEQANSGTTHYSFDAEL